MKALAFSKVRNFCALCIIMQATQLTAVPATIFDWEHVSSPAISPGWLKIGDTFAKGSDAYVMTSQMAGYTEMLYCSLSEGFVGSANRLNTVNGYTFTIEMRMENEAHDGANIDQRAGFNLVFVGKDNTKSLELGFWMDKIQAQRYDPSLISPTRPNGEFFFGTGTDIDTSVMQKYSVTVLGDAFAIYDQSGDKLFGYMLQDFKGYKSMDLPFVGERDPYSLNGFIYVGDNTESAVATTSMRYMTLDEGIDKQSQISLSGSSSTNSPAKGAIYSATDNAAADTGVWQVSNGAKIQNASDNFVNATGDNRHGVYATGTGSSVDANNLTVSTNGNNAHGIYAANGGKVELSGNTTVVTAGTNSHGIYIENNNAMSSSLFGDIVTKGSNSNAVHLKNVSGAFTIKAGSSLLALNGNGVNIIGGTNLAVANYGSIEAVKGVVAATSAQGRFVNYGDINGRSGTAVDFSSSAMNFEMRGGKIIGDMIFSSTSSLSVFSGAQKVFGNVDLADSTLEIVFDENGFFSALTASGEIDIFGAELFLNIASDFQFDENPFYILQSDVSIVGSFLGASDGDILYAGQNSEYMFLIDYETTGISLQFRGIIPEPSTYAMFISLAALAFAIARKRFGK